MFKYLGLVFLVACGGAVAAQPAAPVVAAKPAVVTPDDLSPNTLRDRRKDAGVRSAATALVQGKASDVKCGKLAKGKDGDEQDLLAGRLRVRAPVGSKAPAPLADAPSVEEESRLIAEDKKLSLAIVARETFQLDPDLYEVDAATTKLGTLDAEAPKFLKATFPSEEALEITPVEIGPAKLRAYAARPAHVNAPPGKDTALALALLIAQDDGTLESVGFYVRGELVRESTDLGGCTRLAERIASSITPGTRKLERSAGSRHVLDVSKEESLALTVPADYVAVHSATTARVTKLRPLSLYQGSINVSLGSGKKIPEGAEKAAEGKLLGKPVEWHGKTTPKGGFLYAAEPVAEGRTAEVLLRATRQAKALEEMRGVAETLAVVKR